MSLGSARAVIFLLYGLARRVALLGAPIFLLYDPRRRVALNGR